VIDAAATPWDCGQEYSGGCYRQEAVVYGSEHMLDQLVPGNASITETRERMVLGGQHE